jgi:hypothetical protein
MKVYIVIASINELKNIKAFQPTLEKHDCEVIVIDEGDERVREKNDKLLLGTHAYYGPREREEWFKQNFGLNYEEYLSVIPKNCHAETSFAFLMAYEEKPDLVISLDDDVFPMQEHDIIYCHANNLFDEEGITVYSEGKWYNTLRNVELNTHIRIFPRGHPYAEESRMENYVWDDEGGRCVLNMGLWAGYPDLDALTILYHGGLNGRCGIKCEKYKREKVIVGAGTFFAICGMNVSFLPDVIPAYYQLYMNFMGINRFDDIWSGVFLKKIANHLGHKICLGGPLVYHDKRPRDIFKDLKSELNGIIINEVLWKIVNRIELDGKTFWDSYNSLTHSLERNVAILQSRPHRKFMLMQIEKMRLWLKAVDKLT